MSNNTLRPGMADRKRRGMLITNNGTDDVEVVMASRTLTIPAGEEVFITPEEVRDPTLREALQERSIAIVRPATQDEDEALRRRIEAGDE
jgi:DNA-directed RNA polymerase subunit K/omega